MVRSDRWAESTRAHFRAPENMPLLVDVPPAASGAVGRLTPSPRRRHRMLRTNSARLALEPFTDAIATGEPFDYEVMTNGEFSLLDAVLVLLDQAGPSDVAIATWSAGLYDMEVLNRFVSTKLIRSFRLVLDVSFRNNRGNNAKDGTSYAAVLEDVFGPETIRTTRTHAKFVTITGGAHEFSITSTANLNENKRLEIFALSSAPDRAAFYERIVDELFEGIKPGWHPDRGAPALERVDPTGTHLGAGMVAAVGTVTT